MIRAIATLTTTLAALGGCGVTDQPADVASSTVPPTTRPAQVIVIGEYYAGTFNAEGGDTLILVMEPEGDVVGRCLDYGGEPIYNPRTLIWTCEKVDF